MEDADLDITPMIDMTFLLLVYFMTTASLVKSEADLGIRLPGMVQQAQTVDMPDEQIVEITANGDVFLNGRRYDDAVSHDLPQLAATLVRYRLAAGGSRNEAMVTIAATEDTTHQRVIDVMNACAAAGIRNVTFSATDD
jgi:biopolymer transport protein ExbD